MMRKKRIYTVAAVCLLVLLYMMIFLLSSDVAEDSSMKSSAVTELLLKIWSFFQNSDGTPTTEIVVDLFPLALEKIVRKLAHFFRISLCRSAFLQSGFNVVEGKGLERQAAHRSAVIAVSITG